MKWKIAAAILLAVALPASATPVQYAIGMVKVKNGNPIRGVGDVIFQRSFGPGCSLQLQGTFERIQEVSAERLN